MRLIIITGAPASGKSSIAETVGKRLNIRAISKDGFKISLFEKYGFTNHSEKKKLSIKGEKMMHDTIREYVDKSTDLIVDNNFKDFNELRNILEASEKEVHVICVYCVADYVILAERYNERISRGDRHPALYSMNQYPVIAGVSKFHPLITAEDVARIEREIKEYTYGERVLEINTDHIDKDFERICERVIKFISEDME